MLKQYAYIATIIILGVVALLVLLTLIAAQPPSVR